MPFLNWNRCDEMWFKPKQHEAKGEAPPRIRHSCDVSLLMYLSLIYTLQCYKVNGKSNLHEYIDKNFSTTCVTDASRMSFKVWHNFWIMWQPMNTQIVQCKIQTLLRCPEMSTKQLAWEHISVKEMCFAYLIQYIIKQVRFHTAIYIHENLLQQE